MSGSELWKEHRHKQKKRRLKRLPRRVGLILNLQYSGYTVEQKTVYHYRITKKGSRRVVDIFPTHLSFHDVTTNKRGTIYREGSIRRFIESRFVIGTTNKKG